MGARLQSWWQKVNKPPLIAGTIAFLVVLIVIVLGYWLKWGWTGFLGKTLWDWLGLLAVLAIPIVVGLGVAWFTTKFNEQQSRTERGIASDNQRQVVLQAYLDKMSELLLKENLSKSKLDDEIRIIARTRTLTVLSGLDSIRKASLLRFLQESGLIRRSAASSVLNMEGADLNQIKSDNTDLHGADLHGTNLSKANLNQANLSNINLSSADLRNANLNQVDLSGADLSRAILSGVDLREANVQGAILREAKLFNSYLSGADLSKADLSFTDLSGANLSDMNRSDANLRKSYLEIDILRRRSRRRSKGVYKIVWFLSYSSPSRLRLLLKGGEKGANLNGADLREADLSKAYLGLVNLKGANLSGTKMYLTNLSGADLTYANLSKSHVTEEQLAEAKSLKGATMPDGSIHP